MYFLFNRGFYFRVGSIFNCSWSIVIYYRNNLSYLVAEVELPLPDPDEFFQDSFDLAFPQVLAWSAAATGILLTVMIIKAFINK